MKTHGMTGTRVHYAWLAMRSRCNNVMAMRYDDWGGRGIGYEKRWDTFENFYADMGECPEGLTLERKDNEKGYSKENCVWATASAQAYNRRLSSKNTSGIKGVHWVKRWARWIASAGPAQTQLYRGRDFFEACCARKSWEAANLQGGN